MKFLIGIIATVVFAATVFMTQNASAQNVNNFRISSYKINYELSKDQNGRSVLKTDETVVAQFPSSNQNHGLERAIPAQYDGHTVGLNITSVTDGNGASLQYETHRENDMLITRIGDPDSYVHGTQTYNISYLQYDVTRFFADTNKDEWYWDTNGTQWKVPIDSLAISIEVNDALLSSRAGDPTCFKGVSGSTSKCSLVSPNGDDYSFFTTDLKAGENVTVAFGFNKGTFVHYEPTLFERIVPIWLMVSVVTGVLGLILLFWLSSAYYRRRNRLSELAIVVTEYIPPKNTSVIISGQVITPMGSVFSAQLIDFAVRHYIEIIEMKAKSFWQSAEYDIKIITDPSTLLEEEREILSDMFGTLPKVGDRLELKSLLTNRSYFRRTLDNDKKIKNLVEGQYAIREKSVTTSKFFYRWAIVALVFGVLTLSPFVLLVAGIVALQGVSIRPLTNKGLELRRYLLGLQKYIKAAEAERLKFLQGPDTAQKVGESVDVNNQGQLLKLYERVLPYAIVFGIEKEWAKRLGEFYETNQTNPDWYSGNAVFNAVVFSSAISNFSTAASYSGGSGSSSSGGTGGGGSSGGGGGGGGGGGW